MQQREQEPAPSAVLGEEEHEEEGQIDKAPLHIQHPMKKKKENLKVKFEADTGSSGSDLEIVCIKPASKKDRRVSPTLRKKRQAPNPPCVDLLANKATT